MFTIKKITVWLSVVLITSSLTPVAHSVTVSDIEYQVLNNKCLSAKSSPVKELKLIDIICMAVQRYPTIASATAGYAGQLEMIDAAQSGYYPQISFDIQTTKASGIRDGYANTPKLSIRQRIYDFGKISSSIERTTAEVEQQKGNLLQQIDNIIVQSSSIALEIQRLETLTIKTRNLIKAINKVLNIAASRSNSGISNQSDYIQAKSRLEAAQANLLDLQTQLNTARRKLATYLGNEYINTKLAVINDKLFNRSLLKYQLNEPQVPIILINLAAHDIAQAQLNSANATLLPTISLVGSVEKTIHGYNPNNGKYRGNYNYIGLSVEQSIFSGGENSAKIKSAQRMLNSANYDIKTVKLELNDQVDALKLNLSGTELRLTALQARLKSIDQTRNLYREQYTLGSRPILDLLNSEEELYQAEINLVNTQHDQWFYYLQYLVLTGNARQFFNLKPIIDTILGQSHAK